VGFLYFLPGRVAESFYTEEKTLKLESLSPGLQKRLFDVKKNFEVAEVRGAAGPGDQPGTILGIKGPDGLPEPFGNFPKKQKWIQMNSGEWLGCSLESPPFPQQIEREQTVSGYLLKDLQGWEWSVPVARHANPQSVTIPSVWWFEQGNIKSQTDPNYQWLWDLGVEVEKLYLDPQGNIADLVVIAVKTLACNYRVGEEEFLLWHQLGYHLLSNSFVSNVCATLCDVNIAIEAKKNLIATTESETAPTASSSSS
jgi:hypothetical protein